MDPLLHSQVYSHTYQITLHQNWCVGIYSLKCTLPSLSTRPQWWYRVVLDAKAIFREVRGKKIVMVKLSFGNWSSLDGLLIRIFQSSTTMHCHVDIPGQYSTTIDSQIGSLYPFCHSCKRRQLGYQGHFIHKPRAGTMELWEPKRKCRKAVPQDAFKIM